jgi:hypothetical protein
MNKILEIHKLFPVDIVNIICSFIFHTYQEIYERNYNKVILCIQNMKRFDKINYFTGISWSILYWDKYSILLHMCNRCGNYNNKLCCN